jgi:hypothetical protein
LSFRGLSVKIDISSKICGGVFMHFEILCLDNAETVKSRTVKTLLYALMANDSLFESVETDEKRESLKIQRKNFSSILISSKLTKC